MSTTTKANSAALAAVCRLVVAARRHGQRAVDVAEVEAALEGVDVEALAKPRPCHAGQTLSLEPDSRGCSRVLAIGSAGRAAFD